MSHRTIVWSWSAVLLVLLVCLAACGPTGPGPTNPGCSDCVSQCNGDEWCSRAKCSGVCPHAQGEGGEGGCPDSCADECADDAQCLESCNLYCPGTETEPQTCEACIADHCGGGDEDNQACIDEKCADACTSPAPAADAGP